MFNLKKLTVLVLFAGAASLGVAGCGGDDSSDTPATVEPTGPAEVSTEVTKDELISQGDGICAEVNAAVGTIAASTTADESIQQQQISDIYSGMAQRLEELGTPTDGDAPTEVVDTAQALADSGSSDGDAALADFQSAATAYGFSECGDAPAAPSSLPDETDGGTAAPAPVDPAPVTPVPVEPAPDPAPAPTPTPPSTGGGVAPTPPSTGGGTSGGSSGGIGPG